MKHSIICWSALGVLTAVVARAQGPAPLAPNTRVRISAPSRQLNGVIGAVIVNRGDSLWLRGERVGDTLVLAVRDLTRLEVSRRQDTHGLAGAGIGLLGGAAVGAILGYAAGDDKPSSSQSSSCRNEDFCFSGPNFYLTAGNKAAIGAVGLGVVGAAIGGVVGYTHRTDRWESVLAPGPRVATISGARARTLNIGVRFRMF